jgi:hypothetical protein
MSSEQRKDNLLQFPDLENARNLFVQLFQTETPLINLGYNTQQREIVKPVLKLMEGEGRVSLKSLEVYFDGIGGATVVLERLKRGGHRLLADKGGHLGFMEMMVGRGFFDNELPTIVAHMCMLPGDKNYSDIQTLVSHLYEGYISNKPVHLEPSAPLSRLKSMLSPNTAIYKAAWTDDDTKLELIIESNFVDKALADGLSDQEIEIWRRLPTQSLDGQSWVPWGKKPNISEDTLKKILDEKRTKIATGQLVFEKTVI